MGRRPGDGSCSEAIAGSWRRAAPIETDPRRDLVRIQLLIDDGGTSTKSASVPDILQHHVCVGMGDAMGKMTHVQVRPEDAETGGDHRL